MLRGLADPVPRPLVDAAAAVCLALVDGETTLWLDVAARTTDVVAYLRFHCGVPVVAGPEDAGFALVSDASAMPALDAFAQGSDEEPERAATVVVQVASLEAGEGDQLTGPGIADRERLHAEGVAPSTARSGPASSARRGSRPRRTRSSCFPTATTSRRPASSAT